MRISCQLIDAGTGNHVWAERFDKAIADLFDMQDEIGARLANQLGTELISAEARRAARAPDADSMDLYFQGMASVNRGSAPENLEQARHFFEQALDRAHELYVRELTRTEDTVEGMNAFLEKRAPSWKNR